MQEFVAPFVKTLKELTPVSGEVMDEWFQRIQDQHEGSNVMLTDMTSLDATKLELATLDMDEAPTFATSIACMILSMPNLQSIDLANNTKLWGMLGKTYEPIKGLYLVLANAPNLTSLNMSGCALGRDVCTMKALAEALKIFKVCFMCCLCALRVWL